MDPEIVSAIASVARHGLTVLAAQGLLNRVLGPSADYIGLKSLGLLTKVDINLGDIVRRAAKRLGTKLDEPGSVPPRVLKIVLSEGGFVEDELAAEYFGGLLAASRTADGKDDSVLSLIKVLSEMTVPQIRLHYLIHRAVREIFVGREVQLRWDIQRRDSMVFLPLRPVIEVLGFSGLPVIETLGFTGLDTAEEKVASTLSGLERLDLVERGRLGVGRPNTLLALARLVDQQGPDGIVACPSHLGLELMLAVHGHGSTSVNRYLDPTLALDWDDGVLAVPDARPAAVAYDARHR